MHHARDPNVRRNLPRCKAQWGQTTGKAVRRCTGAMPPSRRSRAAATGGTPAGLTGVPTATRRVTAPGSRRHEIAGSGNKKPHAPSLSATKDLLNTIIGKPGHVNNGGTPSGTYTTPSQGQAP